MAIESPEQGNNPAPPLILKADLWAGLASMALGLAVLWVGADYPAGTGGRLGPGYTPRLLGVILVGLGGLLVLRAPWTADRIDLTFEARPVVLVLASVLSFAAVFAWAGLVPAILVSVAIANWAAPENGWLSAIGLGLILAFFSWALFVKALRLPIPVLWF